MDSYITVVDSVFQLFEIAGFGILSDGVPPEMPAIHNHINSRRQHLNKGQGATQIKKSIGRGAKGIGDHCSCQHNGFALNALTREKCGSLNHAVSAVGDENAIRRAAPAVVENDLSVCISHFEAVDHHQGLHIYIKGAASAVEHLRQVGGPKMKRARNQVVFLVECPSGHEYLNHTL